MRVAINGLGRIGRQVLRQGIGRPEVELVALNDVAEAPALAMLLKYDSVHGRAPFRVAHGPGRLLLDGREIPLSREADPGRLPFGDLGAEVVLECSGRFNTRAGAELHLRDGVARVILGGPCADADLTLVPGVNASLASARGARAGGPPPFQAGPGSARILSAACPAGQALALLVDVLDRAFGVGHGLATVVESYRNDQRILDLPHPDLNLARAAAVSMIPAPSEAAACLGRVLPAMAGRFEAQAVRVPTPDVSLLDLCVTLERDVTLDEVHGAFRQAALDLPGLVEVLEDPLVSSDLVGATASCILDPFLTRLMAPRFLKLFAWHDNEAAYAARLLDLCLRAGGGQ